jgi:thiamine pyrophosphate-dependent acetolactate synthase large subunit-like protein
MPKSPQKPPQKPSKAGNKIWGSDVIANALREQDVPYVCLNPGASYRGLHDSLVNYLGNEMPQMIVCLHEEHAVAIAHGYATVTGKPLAAIVHSNVGLMHASMAIFQAWCNRMPLVVLGATGPVDAMKRRPWIDWIHTSADQGALVRNYIKWDDQPGSPGAAVESMRRGFAIARARPSGPVYINFDSAIQEQEMEDWPALENVSRYQPAGDNEPPREALDQAIAALAKAKNPLILSGRASRSEDGWKDRVALAEWVGARVLTSLKDAASFPTSHPLYAGETGWRLRPSLLELVKKSDAILCLDWVDPGGTIQQAFPPGAGKGPVVINVSNDYRIHNGWNMDYQVMPAVDVWLATVPETAVTALLGGLAQAKVSPKPAPKPRSVPAIPAPDATSGPIVINDLARVFAAVMKDEPISIMSRSLGWPPNGSFMEGPLDFLGSNGGGGVGSGPGMAIGAALALRDTAPGRLPVAILGDGDFMMGSNALWTAANQEIPMLLVVANNRSYYNDEEHQKHIAEDRHRPVENSPIGQRMEGPAIDLTGIARAQGWDGEGPVTDIAALPDALKTALTAVKNGKCYVLDVLVAPEYVRRPMVEYI